MAEKRITFNMKDVSCPHWQHSWRYNSVARGMPANRGDLLMRSNTHELSDDPSDTWVKQLQHSGLIKALAASDPWHDIEFLPVSGQWWGHGFFFWLGSIYTENPGIIPGPQVRSLIPLGLQSQICLRFPQIMIFDESRLNKKASCKKSDSPEL